MIEKARRIAAHQLEVAEEDVEFEQAGVPRQGPPGQHDAAQAAAFEAWTAHNLPDGMEPGLEATAVFDPPNFSWPGRRAPRPSSRSTPRPATPLARYVAVDDCGTVINPLIVEGQIHGGVAQGVAQALYEEAVYDDDGNLLTRTSWTTWSRRRRSCPATRRATTVTPSPTNPLGVKGVGETGTIAAAPAVINAIVDALSHHGVTDIEMPATPERVWSAITGGQPMIPPRSTTTSPTVPTTPSACSGRRTPS